MKLQSRTEMLDVKLNLKHQEVTIQNAWASSMGATTKDKLNFEDAVIHIGLAIDAIDKILESDLPQ